MSTTAARQAAPSSSSYGGTWSLVKRMIERDQMKAWTYVPLAGGFMFSMATILLRRNMRAMLAAQGTIGISTIAMANAVATSAIVKERSHV